MIVTFLSTGLCIFLVVVLVRFLHTVWWTPIQIRHIMASQGIKGPAYRFLHGNTKEIVRMRGESISTPMDYSSHPIFARIMPDIHAWKQLYGRNYLSWHGPQAQLVVTDPELIKEIMNNKDGAYLKGRTDQFLKKLLGDGILVTEGEKWSKLRKIANHAFYAESLKGMVPAMIASVETMLERWRQREEKEVEVNKESRLLTAEVISRTAFGSSYLEGEKIFAMLMEMGTIVARNRYKIRLPGIGKFLKLRDDLESDKIEQAIRESIIAMINKREGKMMRGEENNYGCDFLGSLIKANHDPDEKNRISVDDMVDECKTFYLAGQETTNVLLAWSLLLLAVHTDWQEKARKEVFELFGQQNPNAEGIARLKIGTGAMIITFLSSGLSIFLLVVLVRFLHKVWWTPIRIRHIMASQGIKGPAYRFLHGNTKEIMRMRDESISTPMDFSSHHIFARLLPDIHAWKQLYGRNYLSWYGPQAQLVVTDPELIKEIMSNKDGVYLKGRLGQFAKKLLGDGISVAEGEKWSKLRKIANHAFYAESLKGMVPAMIASVETMLERWTQHEEKEIEVNKESRLLTAEVISRTAFGSSYLEGEKIFDMLMKMGLITAKNRFKIRLPGSGMFWKSRDVLESDKIEQAIRESITGMIDKREEKMVTGEENNYGSDFLGSLIKANHDIDEKNRISVDEMVDECKTFYFAGQETTNGLLAWSLLLLAIHTDWQEKARKEVFELFGQHNPNAEGIARLKIMSMILNETLRLYPPIISLLRRVEREVRLGKLIVPANTHVMLPLLALHHDPEIWGQDVDLFEPERFADGVAKATNNNIAGFIPFGFGSRICVGLNFAANEAKIALSMILQRYRFTLSPSYIHNPIQILTIRPKNGIPIVFNKL